MTLPKSTYTLGRVCPLCGAPVPDQRRMEWCAGTETRKACSRPVRERDGAAVLVATTPGRWEAVALARTRVLPSGARLSFGHGDNQRPILWEQR